MQYISYYYFQVSATDPDCGVNAMVNYTLGDSFGKQKDFEVRPGTGEICVSSTLDYETRNVYEFPVIATDRGKQVFFSYEIDNVLTLFSYSSGNCRCKAKLRFCNFDLNWISPLWSTKMLEGNYSLLNYNWVAYCFSIYIFNQISFIPIHCVYN